MSRIVTRKKTKQKEVDPKYGVSEWDPSELDVRQTRHGTYGAKPPPKGGTWTEQFKEEAYKLRQRQREAESPEFLSPHSTTDTMDTDEAQEVSRLLKEKIEKDQEEPEYSNTPKDQQYQNVVDVGPTFPTVRELQQKGQETYEEISELEDSGIISFPRLEKEEVAHKKESQGRKVPMETGSLLTSFDVTTGPPPMTFTEPSDFDEIIREGEEYLSRVEQELGASGKVSILSREEKEKEEVKASAKEPLDPEHVTPIQERSPTLRVQTLDSKEKVPIAESTRKDNKYTESEPRSKPPTETITTPVKRLSFERMSEDEEIEEAIKKEKDEVEQVQWELENERMRLAIEKENLERKKFRLAEDRLRALRHQRKVLEDSIMKMSQEIAQDINMTTIDRKQRRINMENEYLNQIDYEEGAVQEYLPTLLRAEEVLPDVMTTDSQISSTVDPIEFMDEKALWKLKLKHMRADQCKTRTHKMYKLLMESAKDPQRREELEQMLLATINNLDKKMGKFKVGLDSYDQKEQYILAKSEQAQKEQEKALKDNQGLRVALEGLQDEQKPTQEELNSLQKEKEEADKKQAALKEKIDEERRKKIQKEQQLEQERQKLKALEKKKREQEELKIEQDKDKKMREERDKELARKIEEQEKRDREREDQEIARKLEEKQRLEKEKQDRELAEQLERERKEEEEMMRRKRREEQLRQEEHIRKVEAEQREELYRIEREHQKLLEKERKTKEKRKVSKRHSKPTEEEQKKEKENLMDTIDTLINGQKPKKPKDLGWDYQKDKEAKKVFERKKELKRQREEEKARKIGNCPECRFPKHPGEDCPCKICGERGHKMEDCPKLKPPPKKPVEESFCIECKKVHPIGKCTCKLCKTEGHLATGCPWLELAAATILPPAEEETGEEPEVQICLHCRSTAHKMEDCAAYKVAQAKLKEHWCYGCKQYGHTIIDCMDEKQ